MYLLCDGKKTLQVVFGRMRPWFRFVLKECSQNEQYHLKSHLEVLSGQLGAGWHSSWSAGWSASWLPGWLARWLACWLPELPANRQGGRLAACMQWLTGMFEDCHHVPHVSLDYIQCLVHAADSRFRSRQTPQSEPAKLQHITPQYIAKWIAKLINHEDHFE